MLSDEEKKALEQLNKRYEFFKENPLATNVWLSLDVYNLGTILNLIEKQQKEIEELKKQDLSNSKIIANMSERHFHDREKIRKYEALQDKIKAKIEEVKDGTYDAKIVLQSLLDKE